MNTLSQQLIRQPGGLITLGVVGGLGLYALGATLIAPLAGAALMALVSGGLAYRAVRTLQEANDDLHRQLAQRTTELNTALTHPPTQVIPFNPLLEAIGAIITSITDSVIVTDRAGAISIANLAAHRLLAPVVPKVLEAPLDAWLAGATVAAERDDLCRVIQTQTQPITGIPVQWLGGRTLSFSLAPINVPGHRRPIGMVLVGRDMTREAELDRLKSRFISTVSHELRTPLIAILSQIEVLTLGGAASLSERQRTATQRVTVNAQHLLRLITDLLDHAQIEAGQLLVLQPIPFAPAALLDDLRATLSSTAEAKGLSLTLDRSPEVPPQLIGDPERLKQILFNLTGNAIKFTEHGTVAVQITRSDVEHWALVVTDTGRGIAPDDQAQVFEPFYRAGSNAGAGLGLSIVKHLVESMQGTLAVNSVIDHGTTFRVDAAADRACSIASVGLIDVMTHRLFCRSI